MDKIKNYIQEEDLVRRIPIFLFGVFIVAFNYNLFIRPNSFVLGGSSGISILLNSALGFDPVICIYVLNVVFLILGAIFLGKKEIVRAIAGSILYPIFITLTTPLAELSIPFVNFNNFLITVLIAGLLNGIGSGLIYKVGYNTGGGDILIKIVNKYLEITEGSSLLLCHGIIQAFGVFILGFNKVVYSVIIILMTSTLVNKILIGISDSKMFFIYSKKYKLIEEYILTELKTGVTVFNTEGGYKRKKNAMLMVVVPTRDYYRVKENVQKIDNDAFYIVSDCYEVDGGIRRKNLPFI